MQRVLAAYQQADEEEEEGDDAGGEVMRDEKVNEKSHEHGSSLSEGVYFATDHNIMVVFQPERQPVLSDKQREVVNA